MARNKSGQLGCGSLILALAMGFLAFSIATASQVEDGGVVCTVIAAIGGTLILLALVKTAAAPVMPNRRRGKERLPEAFNVQNFQTNLRGVTDYQHAVKKCVYKDMLDLVREPLNPYDENAIMVRHQKTGQTLGYIARPIAKVLAKRLDRGDPYVACVLRVVGGFFETKGLVIQVVYHIEAAKAAKEEARTARASARKRRAAEDDPAPGDE